MVEMIFIKNDWMADMENYSCQRTFLLKRQKWKKNPKNTGDRQNTEIENKTTQTFTKQRRANQK